MRAPACFAIMQVSKATIQKLAPLIGMKRKKKGEYSLQLAPATTEAEAMVARAEHDAEIAGLEAIGVQQIRAREQQPTDHAPDVQQHGQGAGECEPGVGGDAWGDGSGPTT